MTIKKLRKKINYLKELPLTNEVAKEISSLKHELDMCLEACKPSKRNVGNYR